MRYNIIDTKTESMKKDRTELIMLGTGNATVTRCYNTCFILQTEKTVLLVDAGGGNGILNQLEKANVPIDRIHDMFVTHAHTDHILGAIWIIRIIAQRALKGQYSNIFHVYGHDKVLLVLDQICHMTLPTSVIAAINKYVQFHEVEDNDTWQVGDLGLQCFDIASTKEKQYGFRALLPDGQTLVCLGDEPYNERNRTYAEGADWLLCEAFCLYKDRERFKPYEKHHSTALDAGRLAQQLGVKNLLLYHTEDKTLDTRKKSYTEETSLEFTGTVHVPDDLEKIPLS